MIGLKLARTLTQSLQHIGRAVIISLDPPPKAHLKIIIVKAVLEEKISVSAKLQQQLETPLERERTGVGGTLVIGGEWSESGTHWKCLDT
ncbi:hypothetical protein PS682_03678 [Pseudomonas fluorescens]|nr:hypothetical protein PS682_03678 [Pseudomonas fluorescens]